MKIILFTDGGSRGNPGPSASGVVIKNEAGEVLFAGGEYLGVQTNNFAEYSALIFALKKTKELGGTIAECVLDSELVVKQMLGKYKVKDPTLQQLYRQVKKLSEEFISISFRHTLRDGNKAADAEVNRILDNPNNHTDQSNALKIFQQKRLI